MINDKRMKYITSEDGYDYYVFTPTLFRQYYNKVEPWTAHRSIFSHKLHMLLYHIRGGYNILYMLEKGDVIAYIIYARCGRTVIKGSTRKDIFIVFGTTHPKYRNRGLQKRLHYKLLHDIGLEFRNSYLTKYDTNIGSEKVVVATGYSCLYQVKRSLFLKTIYRTDKGIWRLYVYKNDKK